MESGRTIGSRALIQASVWTACVLLALLLIRESEVFLVVFAGILFSILFHGVAKWNSDKTGLSQNMALLLSLTLTLVVMGAGIGYVAPDVSQQTSDLIDRIPQAVRQLEWADRLLEHKDHFIGIPPTRDKLSGWPLASLQPLAMR